MGGTFSKKKRLVKYESFSPELKEQALETLVKNTVQTPEAVKFPSYICFDNHTVNTYDMIPALVKRLNMAEYSVNCNGYSITLRELGKIDMEVRRSLDNVLNLYETSNRNF